MQPARSITSPTALHNVMSQSASTSTVFSRVGLVLVASVTHHTELAEWLPVVAAAPLLLFPSPYVLVGVFLIGIGWFARRMTRGRWSVPTAAHWPGRVLLLALVIALVPSVRLDYSAPKFWGVILGLATFYACLNACRTESAIRRVTAVLLGAGAAVSVVGIIAIGGDRTTLTLLPRIVLPIQSSTIVTEGINANELGGVLTLCVPLAVAIASGRGKLRWLALGVMPVLVGALYVSQSRPALSGVVLALVCGALVWIGGRAAMLISAVGAAVLMPFLFVAPDRLVALLVTDTPAAGSLSLVGRVELWQHGLAMLLDSPLTGIGLNTFPVVLDALYPTVHHAASPSVPHVHNLLLQTALDLGLPGLVAFLAILTLAVVTGLRALRRGSHGRLAAGLLLGLLAHGIYSLVDAVALGAKPGPLLWAELGVLVALGSLPDVRHVRATPPDRANRFRPKWAAAGAVAIGVAALLLVVSPLTINAAQVIVRRAAIDQAMSGLLAADLDLGSSLAWGPYQARVWATRSFVAKARGDADAELNALAIAAPLATWDSSLALRLGEQRLDRGDLEGAVMAWRLVQADDPLLERGQAAEHDRAPTSVVLNWYSLAQAVDPTDWRPYAAAAKVTRQPDQAAALLGEALRRRGDQPARAAVAQRLGNPSAAAPTNLTTPVSSEDADLYLAAAHAMASNADVQGAILAAQLATQASPMSSDAWSYLAELWQSAGQPRLAEAAQQRAAALAAH
jgi:putative inorganic carbon (HCO3(-)) transporter